MFWKTGRQKGGSRKSENAQNNDNRGNREGSVTIVSRGSLFRGDVKLMIAALTTFLCSGLLAALIYCSCFVNIASLTAALAVLTISAFVLVLAAVRAWREEELSPDTVTIVPDMDTEDYDELVNLLKDMDQDGNDKVNLLTEDTGRSGDVDSVVSAPVVAGEQACAGKG